MQKYKSRNTWSNRQIWPWEYRMKQGQENALVIANTLFQQHKRKFYTWTSPDGQHQNQIDYILYNQQKQDQELTMAQILKSLLPNSDLN